MQHAKTKLSTQLTHVIIKLNRKFEKKNKHSQNFNRTKIYLMQQTKLIP